ncbi:hypothetical protein LJR290_007641 [Variovorax sp. LjRoot290]|uniref:hypothetical protein n=1 Tax=Variovorax sp. LjRoot290 TaxID=3342316 RepID=UPI003ECEE64D
MPKRESRSDAFLRVLKELWPVLQEGVLKRLGAEGKPDVYVDMTDDCPFMLEPRDYFKLDYYAKYVRRFKPVQMSVRNAGSSALRVRSAVLIAILDPIHHQTLEFYAPGEPSSFSVTNWSSTLNFQERNRPNVPNVPYALTKLDSGSVLPLEFPAAAVIEFSKLAHRYHSGAITENLDDPYVPDLRLEPQLDAEVRAALPNHLCDVAQIGLQIWTDRNDLVPFLWDRERRSFFLEFWFSGVVRFGK